MRSRGLAAAGLLLMASAAALGAVLAHDGDPATTSQLAQAEPGQRVEVKGSPEPFAPTFPLRDWRHILPMLGNASYLLESDGVAALLTGEIEAPDGVAVAEGTVLWVGPHPDAPEQLLVVVQVTQWREPILMR